MLFQNIEFFNIAEITPAENGGYDLHRFPKSFVDVAARDVAECATCAEIRFVTDSDEVELTLSTSGDSWATAYVYFGDYKWHATGFAPNTKSVVRISRPDMLKQLSGESLDAARHNFSHRVVRVILSNHRITFHGIDAKGGSLRAPRADEVPAVKMLAYGSSITHGCWADLAHLSYTHILGNMLGWDVLNKGMSGSCRIEPEAVEYFKGEEYDVLFLELGTNMLNPNDFDAKTVIDRAGYMLSELSSARPEVKIYVTGAYYLEIRNQLEPERLAVKHKLDAHLRSLELPNVTYLSAEDIFKEPHYTSFDLVHPSEYGHIHMANNLARMLEENESQ